MYNLHNHDPLSYATLQEGDVIQKSVKRGIRNIIKSYTGYYDIFSELIQNSLDALEAKWMDNKRGYNPKLNIDINIKRKTVTVSDNGVGMSEETFQFFLAPHCSYKDAYKWSRGNKGVGATFLAYNYNNLYIESKEDDYGCVELLNGRRWAESNEDERPLFNPLANPLNDFLENEENGTVVRIKIDAGIKPNLEYNLAENAVQWDAILRIKTPLGGIYLAGESEFDDFLEKLKVTINVTSSKNENTTLEISKPEYVFPHDIEGIKIEGLDDVLKERERASIEGQNDYLPQYTSLHGYYNFWTKEDLLPPEDADVNDIDEKLNIASNINEEKTKLIEKYNVSVYGMLMYSTKVWDEYSNNQLGLRKNTRILKGGLQVACDRMPQGELIEIPLTSNIGLQRQSHVVVHFEEGNPDLGRKTFQPEMTELAKTLAGNVVRRFLHYRHDHFKTDDSASTIASQLRLSEYIRTQEDNAIDTPLGTSLSCVKQISKPKKENDVIALFNQLLGGDIIKGIQIYATEPHEQYDSLIKVSYSEELDYDSQTNPLGLPPGPDTYGRSHNQILEYKFDFNSLIKDFETGTKNPSELNLLVAWNASRIRYQREYELRSLLIEDRYNSREIHGATHIVYMNNNKMFHVILLEDLLHFIKFQNNQDAIDDFQSKYTIE